MLSFFRKKMKLIMILVVIIFAGTMFYGLSFTGRGMMEGPKGIKGIAKINGREIDAFQYREFLNRITRQFGGQVSAQQYAWLETQALQQTIDFTLILNEAKKKARVSGQEMDQAINNIVQQGKYASKRDFEFALKKIGLSMGQFKELVKNEILVQKMIYKVREGVAMTPDDLREVRASHILLSTEATAKDILTRVKKGEDFAALAKKYSLDVSSAIKGGDLGYFTISRMVEPFGATAFKLKIGEVGEIIKTEFGYHVLKVTDSRLKKFKGEAKDIEKTALAEKQDMAFQKWFNDLRGKAKVEITHPGLLAHTLRFRGRVLEAVESYKKAIALSPANAHLHVFLGDTYMMVKKPELALIEYENAVKVEGGNPEFYIILANAYEQIGKTALAIEQFKRASLVAGDNRSLHEVLLKKFRTLKASKEAREEEAEIARIAKKEKFEKDLQVK